ncbi:MAG: hypothetical protein OCC49_09790 [Fibrobacterales bacterium]
MKKILYLISIITLLNLFGCGKPDGYTLLRQDQFVREADLKDAPQPDIIWSKLSPFEQWIIASESKTISNQLALTLLYGDSVRTLKEYLPFELRIKEFLAHVSPKMYSLENNFDKGRFLFEAMVSNFYPTLKEGLKDYILDQNSVKSLVENGVYGEKNTVLLYALLAEYFDLNPRVLKAPTHSYVQLMLGGDSVVNVETTDVEGYNWNSSRNDYSQIDTTWFSKRGWVAASASDQNHIDTLTITEMIRFAYSSRFMKGARQFENDMAFLEMKVLIMANDPHYTEQLLIHYQEKIDSLMSQGDTLQLDLFFKVIQGNFSKMVHNPKPTEVYYTAYRWVALNEVIRLYVHKKYYEVLERLASLNRFIPAYNVNSQYAQYNFNWYFKGILDELIEKGRYGEAITLHNRYTTTCEWIDQCKNNLGWVYISSIETLWKKESWKKVIDLYTEFNRQPYAARLKESIISNKEVAYVNWSIKYSNDDAINDARKVLNRCLFEMPEAMQCKDRLDIIDGLL